LYHIFNEFRWLSTLIADHRLVKEAKNLDSLLFLDQLEEEIDEESAEQTDNRRY
jgi:hypothetical protein